MTSTEKTIKLLEQWFDDVHYDNLVESIRWLIYNRNDIDKPYCIKWLNDHNEEVRKPHEHYICGQIANVIQDKMIVVEEMRKVRK